MWLGTMWLPHSGLPLAGGVRTCFWFHKSAVGHAIGQDVIVNMIKSGKWDEVAARKQLQTISDVQAEARYHRAHYLFEVSRVLTPEQKAKLHEMLSGGEAMY